MHKALITFLASLFLVALSAQERGMYFSLGEEEKEIYELIIQLRFETAKEKLLLLQNEEPQNLIRLFLENYIDCLSILISEDKASYERLKANKNLRLRLLQKGDKDDPLYYYTQAEIRLQWAAVKMKFGKHFSAFQEVNRANKLLIKNQKLFPDFVLNKKSLGLLHSLIGTVPDAYQWSIELMSSLEGSLTKGRKELEEMLEYARSSDDVLALEAKILYAYAMLYIYNEPEKAWELGQELSENANKSPLLRFVIANLAMRTGRNDYAIKTLDNISDPAGTFTFHYLEFMRGMAKLRSLDPSADEHFESFVNNYKGKNFVKEAYQKLAWHQVIHGTNEGYFAFMKFVLSEGESEVGEDKKALNEAREAVVPHPEILKSRLLFDGGYFDRSAQELSKVNEDELKTYKNSIQFPYRKGRAYQALGKTKEALDFFKLTIEMGERASYYYACSAALQAGVISENEGNFELAKKYFEKSLNIRPDEYRNSLHQQAKSGLKRIEQKKQQQEDQ